MTTTASTRTGTMRSRIAAFALAALAIGGIGAALTSAAWTDNVFFRADATAASFNLQGSLAGTSGPWVESDNETSIDLAVPASTFENLVPGQTRTVPLYVFNDGSVPAALTTTFVAAGTLFDGDAVTVAVTGTPATLAAGASATLTLTVTTPSDWDKSYQESTGTIVVTVAGQTTAS